MAGPGTTGLKEEFVKHFPRRPLLAAAAASLCMPAIARAQGGRAIRFVVPFATGGLTDIITRLIAQNMAETLGQTIVVENRPGGNAIIASEAVARAPADGLTVLVGGTAGLPLNAMMRPNLPFRLEDFAPVALLFDGPLSLTVNAGLPPRDIASFVAHAKAEPNPLRYATNGTGSVSHLFGIMMADAMGIRLTDVAYRGNGPSTTDLLAGVIEISVEAPTTTIEHVRAGKLRILGLSYDERAPLLPEILTFKEAGYPALVTSFWTALLVPARTPAAEIARLNAAANKAMQSEAVRDRLASEALRAISGPPSLLDEQMQRDKAQWGRIITERKITLE
ncbi:tripartite tricarboxylate transporter substrate binding protein [Pseudoroseomonas wenyumeiae]|uniref:Tripartite tricarboxylate transporter substrate binding protein n=1 Tax=Teichococcus wenyumeiae TaxID=2478470 RepID=A0A3A9J9N9_9PROT|nr:tripartite tricarboxylate transporter substrate binding protein [Pseudoroseomonas wenyumeiae]RKK01433.1 tripartite tricarboxylate transporter substrate binding protein [Pseudoroseomonas wenyumeiae]RMI19603.1 tripartite tricarboxylate transporter substrate binding protein [Pseudoroseomonas wenyumeiae]